MENSFNEQIRLQKARKKVKTMKEFYRHLIVYLAVNVLLWIMHFADIKPGESFFCWSNFSVAFFWGIGLFCHWLGAFKPGITIGKEWERRKIQELMERENNNKKQWQ